MKILLINPPFYRFLGLEQDYVPISLLSVGSYLSELGHDVYFKNMEIDENMGYLGYNDRANNYDIFINSINNDVHPVWEELKKTIEYIKPDKIGISVINVKYKSALKIIEIADIYNIPVMVGGQHPTIMSNDYYPKNVEIIKGEFESSIIKTSRIKNLDSLPFPNYDILLDKYSKNGYGHIMSARGCPYSCTFCASSIMWGKKVTFKSMDNLINEMNYINKRFGTDYFTFWDETWTMNKKRVFEFSKKYNVPAKWRCDTRADSLDEDIIKAMVDSNMGQMSIGIETSDENILKKIGKNETQKDFINAANLLNKYNVQWKAYMIIGFPYDTEESIRNSIKFVKNLNPFRITLSFFTPYIGTLLYNETKKMGLITDDYDMSLISHQSPHNYFCPSINKNRYLSIKNEISKEIDDYNKDALKIWH